MRNSAEIVRKALTHQDPEWVPRSELWISSEILVKMGHKDTLEGLLSLRQQLGMDVLFLPVSDTETFNFSQSYRFFSVRDIPKALDLSNLFVAGIIDGPFQRLVEEKGLLSVLNVWRKDNETFLRQYRAKAESVTKLVNNCMETGIKLVVIADDLAYELSTYLNPLDSREFLVPFYHEIAQTVHRNNGYMLFHSCGNIKGLLPHLMSAGIDGLAACQIQFADLLSLKKNNSSLLFFAGIEPRHFSSDTFSDALQGEFLDSVRELAKGGGFFLCSSCGLYNPEFVGRLRELYRLLEK